ncbi:ABC-2 type transport system permease protein [Amycolatopsis xylanica]|uniref:ABC-2 type transport system permease protein n=1 Tax=Amycolatopsis xylanica TaxID=589385 RepID=A0A1H3AXU6_9PSEU|nr:ABC transporter permease [Amycolatopsis xylanica]SDX33944.1 ABC-2 type transport system permease protein [Amycolatopsis xylanica]
MSALTKLTATEAKLALRAPFFTAFGLLFPAVLLLAIGAIPGMRAVENGRRFIDGWAPSMIVVALAMLGLQAIPAAVATYRETGVLRRMATTPVHPANLLVAQLLVHVTTALLGIGLLIVAGAAVFGIPGPRHPLSFLLALVLGTVSVFSLGLLSAALAKTAKTASGIAMLAFIPIMFFGGVYVPRQFLPEVIQRIGAYLPPGIQALEESWTGAGAQPLQLVVLAGAAIGTAALAAKVFRWE